MRRKETRPPETTFTTTAVDAYEALKTGLPIMKAWEQTECLRDEEHAYTLFDGTRLGRKRNGQVRMKRPQDMPLIVPASWTKLRIHDHVRRAVDVSKTCSISPADADAFLRTGLLPGKGRSRNYMHLQAELAICTDANRQRARRRKVDRGYYGHQVLTRKEALLRVIEHFREHETGVLQSRITHHMIGSRRGNMGMHRQVVHVLWRRMVVREIALETLRAYGRKCTVADYNRVAASWNIPCGPDKSRDRGISTLRHTHRSAFVLHQVLFPKKGGPAIVDAIQMVPDRLREVVGNAKLWRATTTWTDPQLGSLARLIGRMTGEDAQVYDPIDDETGRLLMARIAERDPWPALLLSYLSWLPSSDIGILLPFLPALHAAGVEARRRRRLRLFTSSCGLVMDMLRGLHEDDYASLAQGARNATWARLDERQVEWHRTMAEIRRQEVDAEYPAVREWSLDDCWSALLGHHVDANGEATEIVDVRGLDREALELNHCVDDYAPYCISGASRIFSLRTDEHRSTLELRRRYGVWHITQNYGFDNTIPDKSLKMLGTAVARAANAIARRQQRG